MTDNQFSKTRYPNAFLFGSIAGMVLQMVTRGSMGEPFSARPFAYLKFALIFGCGVSYWDYWRRCAMEQVLYSEEKIRYYQTVKAINASVRYGEEDEIQNLTEYLAGYSSRA